MKKLFATIALLGAAGVAVGVGYADHVHTHEQAAKTGMEIRDDHSGGTNASGCHTNHSTGVYHCH